MSAPLDLVEDLSLATPESPGLGNLWWLAVPAVLLIGLGLAYLFRRRRERLAAPVPPERNALADLKALEAEIDRLDARTFALQLSLILRVYIERRFGLHAPSHSTEEFLAQAGASPLLNTEQQAWIAGFLNHCDQAKFALADIENQTKRSLHQDVLHFVQATTPTA
jgi:hypothetical protein